jgi:hypothetical protein
MVHIQVFTNWHFWGGLIVTTFPYWFPILVAFITVILMKFASKRKENLLYIKATIKVLKSLLGDKLGNKANLIFDDWLECIEKVQNGTWTQEQMIEEFIHIVNELKGVRLTNEEINNIREVTKTSVQILSNPVYDKVSICSIKLD